MNRLFTTGRKQVQFPDFAIKSCQQLGESKTIVIFCYNLCLCSVVWCNHWALENQRISITNCNVASYCRLQSGHCPVLARKYFKVFVRTLPLPLPHSPAPHPFTDPYLQLPSHKKLPVVNTNQCFHENKNAPMMRLLVS